MFNMMFLMIPYGAVIAYSSILAQEKNLTSVIPYFYIFLVIGMLVSSSESVTVSCSRCSSLSSPLRLPLPKAVQPTRLICFLTTSVSGSVPC